jgi:hypothetical protein
VSMEIIADRAVGLTLLTPLLLRRHLPVVLP